MMEKFLTYRGAIVDKLSEIWSNNTNKLLLVSTVVLTILILKKR